MERSLADDSSGLEYGPSTAKGGASMLMLQIAGGIILAVLVIQFWEVFALLGLMIGTIGLALGLLAAGVFFIVWGVTREHYHAPPRPVASAVSPKIEPPIVQTIARPIEPSETPKPNRPYQTPKQLESRCRTILKSWGQGSKHDHSFFEDPAVLDNLEDAAGRDTVCTRTLRGFFKSIPEEPVATKDVVDR